MNIDKSTLNKIWNDSGFQEVLKKLLTDNAKEDLYVAAAENDNYPLGYVAPGRFASDAFKNAFEQALYEAAAKLSDKHEPLCDDCHKTFATENEGGRHLCKSCAAKIVTKVNPVIVSGVMERYNVTPDTYTDMQHAKNVLDNFAAATEGAEND